MTIAAVRNGLVTTIQNFGKWSASQISTCDFGIAELTASSVVLQPGPNSLIEPLSYRSTACATTKGVTWDFTGVVLVKDPGDPRTLLGNLWVAVDDIFSSVNSDDTFGGVVEEAHIVSISRPSIDSFFTTGNVDFGYVTFSVRAYERI